MPIRYCTASSFSSLKQKIVYTIGVKEKSVRIEVAFHCSQEGKPLNGCPTEKSIIRRKIIQEKFLVITKNRTEHTCEFKWIIIAIIAWDGMDQSVADRAYGDIIGVPSKHGKASQRKCGLNSTKTCNFQGFNDSMSGASFSFGCSWSMIFNSCNLEKMGIDQTSKSLN